MAVFSLPRARRALAAGGWLTWLLAVSVGCTKKEAATFPSLDTWQGTLTVDLLSGGKSGTVTVAKRGDVYRFEAPDHAEVFGTYGGDGPREFLFDGKAKTLTLVVDGSKRALDYDLTVLGGVTNDASKSPFELAPSGRSDTVAGFPCDVWVGSADAESVEACVVTQAAHVLPLGIGFLPLGAGWAKPLLDGEHVPLSVVVQEGGTVTWKARLAKLDRAAPAGSFDVPPDYDRESFLDALRRLEAKQGQ